MKMLIGLMTVLVSATSFADVGDKYSKPLKLGRYSYTAGLAELIGFTEKVDHDGDDDTPQVTVRVALDLNEKSGSEAYATIDMGDGDILVSYLLIDAASEFKMLGSIVYDPADIYKTDQCLGKDMIYADPEDTHGNELTCYAIQAKDIIIK